jgi:hypothetical protein
MPPVFKHQHRILFSRQLRVNSLGLFPATKVGPLFDGFKTMPTGIVVE